MQTPLVSVLMTAYNREPYIAQAIESVLASSFPDFELIICDNCSTDRTLEIARGYAAKDSRIRVYVNESNLGDYPNRNRAASYARGEYLKYLDSDDVMYPYTLQIMVDYMEQFPQAGFGLCAVHDDARPYPISISPRQAYLEHFYNWGHFGRGPGSSIIRRKAFEKVGGFTGERFIGDVKLWFALAREYEMVKLPPYLYWNRLHPGQESQHEQAKTYPKLWKQAIDEAFSHIQCPLTPVEIKAVRQKMLRDKRKKKILEYVKRVIK